MQEISHTHFIKSRHARSLLVACFLAAFLSSGLTQELAPPIVIISNQHSGAQIWAQDRAGAPLVNAPAVIESTTGAGSRAGMANITGANLQLNGQNISQPRSMVVQGQISCPSTVANWAGAATCSSSIPQTLAGSNATATDSTGPAVGSATFTCQADGAWSAPFSATCTSTCGATPVNWTVGANTCNGVLAARTTGQSLVATDSTSPTTGSASYTCSAAGSWSVNAGFNCTGQAPLGSLPGDIFNWTVNVRENGDTNGNSQQGFATQAEISSGSAWVGNNINDPTNYEYGTPYAILHSVGSGFRVANYWGASLNTVGVYGPWQNPAWLAYIQFYGTECAPATRSLRMQWGGYISITGVMCRKGYVP